MGARPSTSRVAIPGTGDLAHLEENMAAAGLTLLPAERAALDHAAVP